MHCRPKVNDGNAECDQHNTENQHAPSSNRKGEGPNKPWQDFRMLWGKRQRQFGKHYVHRRAFQCPHCQTSYTILMASNHYFQNPPIITNGIDIRN